MEDLRKSVWEGMLSADLSVRYYDALARRFYVCDLWAKIFFAVTSSSVVAGWAVWNDPKEFPSFNVTWKVVSACSAVLAISVPFFQHAKKLEIAGRVKCECIEIQKEYELLWSRVDDDSPRQVEAQLRKIWSKEHKVNSIACIFSGTDKKLANRCHYEVNHARRI